MQDDLQKSRTDFQQTDGETEENLLLSEMNVCVPIKPWSYRFSGASQTALRKDPTPAKMFRN